MIKSMINMGADDAHSECDDNGAGFLRPDALPDANQDKYPGVLLGASVAFAFNSLA